MAENSVLNASYDVDKFARIRKGALSEAEGRDTLAPGDYSHAEGFQTVARGIASHVEGRDTVTTNEYEHAQGRYNVSHEGTTRHSVGIGTAETDRKNAFEIHNDGKVYIKGVGSYDGTNPEAGINDLSTVVGSGASGGILVGTVSENTAHLPSWRPSGDTLVLGDYVKVHPNSTLPFTVDGITFSDVKDTAVWSGTEWLYNANAFQKTNETPVYSRYAESISGTAPYQNAINIENKEQILARIEHRQTMTTASIDLIGKDCIQYTGIDSGSFVHNRFYEVVSDGTGGAKWQECDIAGATGTIVGGSYLDVIPTGKIGEGKHGIVLVRSDGLEIYFPLEDASGSVITRTDTVELKNKTVDADLNTVSNLKVNNFTASAVSTNIALASSALDTKLTTEKAVRTELDLKQDTLIPSASGNIIIDADGKTISSNQIDDTSTDSLQKTWSVNKIVDEIRVAAATFRGAFDTKADLEAYSGEKEKNDRAIVTRDETHADGTAWYSYNGTVWIFEYVISTSAISLDGITVDYSTAGKIEVKDGGITFTKLSGSLVTLSITSESPDTQVPSAKAVYDAISGSVSGKYLPLSGGTMRDSIQFDRTTVYAIRNVGTNQEMYVLGGSQGSNGGMIALAGSDHSNNGRVFLQAANTDGKNSHIILEGSGSFTHDDNQILDTRDILDELTSSSSIDALSANQGKLLNEIKENIINKVTEVTNTSTDEEYPSAKAVYNTISSSSVKIDNVTIKKNSSGQLYSPTEAGIVEAPTQSVWLDENLPREGRYIESSSTIYAVDIVDFGTMDSTWTTGSIAHMVVITDSRAIAFSSSITEVSVPLQDGTIASYIGVVGTTEFPGTFCQDDDVATPRMLYFNPDTPIVSGTEFNLASASYDLGSNAICKMNNRFLNINTSSLTIDSVSDKLSIRLSDTADNQLLIQEDGLYVPPVAGSDYLEGTGITFTTSSTALSSSYINANIGGNYQSEMYAILIEASKLPDSTTRVFLTNAVLLNQNYPNRNLILYLLHNDDVYMGTIKVGGTYSSSFDWAVSDSTYGITMIHIDLNDADKCYLVGTRFDTSSSDTFGLRVQEDDSTLSIPRAVPISASWIPVDYKTITRDLTTNRIVARIPNVIDSLTSSDTTATLSANQGKVLNNTKVDTDKNAISGQTRAKLLAAIGTGTTKIFPRVNFTGSSELDNNISWTVYVNKYSNVYGSITAYKPTSNEVWVCSCNNGTWKGWERLLGTSTVVDNLTSTSTNMPLSANQGKVLLDKLSDGSVTKVGTGTVGGTLKLMYLNSGTPTNGTQLYNKNITINGSNYGVLRTANSDIGSMWVPTTSGSKGNVLISQGSAAPKWSSGCLINTLLWSGSLGSGNVSLSESYKNFTFLVLQVKNSSNEQTHAMYLPYIMVANQKMLISDTSRWMLWYSKDNTNLYVQDNHNMTLQKVVGIK